MTGITLIIAGCREFIDAEFVESSFIEHFGGRDVVEIIHGGCRGVDSIAGEIARQRDIPCREFPANFSYGKIGGPARNQAMVDEGDALLVFWRPDCQGSIDVMSRAKSAGIEVVDICISDIPNYRDPF